MAQICIDIPDNRVPRVLDAMAAVHGYDPAGGQTKAQFTKATLISIIKDAVVGYEAAAAADVARTAAEEKARGEIELS